MFPLIKDDNDKIGHRHIRDRHHTRKTSSGPHLGLLQSRPPPILGDAYYDYNNDGSSSSTTAPTTSSYDDNNTTTTAAATGVWNYMLGVTLCLIFYVLTLMLPKGLRKQFFGSNPRRYSKRRYDLTEFEQLAGGATPLMMMAAGAGGGDNSTNNLSALDSVDESILMEVQKRRIMNDTSIDGSSSAFMSSFMSSHHQQQQEQQHHQPQQSNNVSHMTPTTTTPYSSSSHHNQNKSLSTVSDYSDTGSVYLRPMTRSNRNSNHNNNNKARGGTGGGGSGGFRAISPSFGLMPPSPGHPAIHRLPSAKILNETMQRLKSRGIRLVAHGVASESKRVWIKLEEDTQNLSWQTEFARKVPNQLGEVSIVMMRGALHRIALPNILFVDVGKKTNALTKPDNRDVPESVCFSLLTQNGSLDLQTNSRLERDALVSCFSMVLDEVHTQDWRSLYAESPETSAVQSSCTGSDLNQVEF